MISPLMVIVVEHGLDLVDAVADGLLFIECGEDNRDFDWGSGWRRFIGLSLMDFFVRQ